MFFKIENWSLFHPLTKTTKAVVVVVVVAALFVVAAVALSPRFPNVFRAVPTTTKTTTVAVAAAVCASFDCAHHPWGISFECVFSHCWTVYFWQFCCTGLPLVESQHHHLKHQTADQLQRNKNYQFTPYRTNRRTVLKKNWIVSKHAFIHPPFKWCFSCNSLTMLGMPFSFK